MSSADEKTESGAVPSDDPRAEGLESLARLRDTPSEVVKFWVVRVVIVAVLIWLVNRFFGPFGWVWWLLPAYVVLSLLISIIMTRVKERQLDRIERIYKDDRLS